jgi:hypothetical protein
MNDDLSRDLRRKLRRRKGDTARLAAQLAPLEEQTKRAKRSNGDGNNLGAIAHQEVGAIVIEGPTGGLSKELAEVQESDHKPGFEPVVLVILLLALGFIVFIAWEVSKMPAPPTP